MTALVLALAGTDHHPFNRLVEWIDAAAVRHPDVRFLIQHGTARPPRVADGVDYLGYGPLVELLLEASVVVCHGGPGLITDAREARHVPLCVPRDPDLGEHVDGHQQRFAKMVGEVGVVRDVRSAATFQRELSSALAQPPVLEVAPASIQARDAARALVAVELNDVMTALPPRRLVRRRVAR